MDNHTRYDRPVPPAHRLTFTLALLSIGCSEPALLMNNQGYCERGGAAGDCIFLSPDNDGDPATLGRLSVKSRGGGPAYVRRSGRKKFTLHRDGKIVGSITIPGDDASFIEVTLTDGPPFAKTLRMSGPGGPME